MTTEESFKMELEARKPLIDALTRYAELAIKSLLLISGGAAVALAGFAGGALKVDTSTVVLQSLASSIWWFAISAAGAVATAGLAYLSQSFVLELSHPLGNRVGAFFRWAAIVVFIVSLGFFLIGAWAASTALNPSQAGGITMDASPWLIIAGLVLNLIGVVLLFRYGMPYRVRTGGEQALLLEQKDQAAVRAETFYAVMGWLGLVLVVVGTASQIFGTILGVM